jgi:hypothetical protein
MPNYNSTIQLKGGFFHSLGKVITEVNNLAGNERYKSAHNVKSNEVWLGTLPYAPTIASASSYSDDITIRAIGSLSSPTYLYPLPNTNYQTWFFDSGTPSPALDGFEPSVDWCKPLINSSDAPSEEGLPSVGYDFRFFDPTGTSWITYPNANYEVDYFSGLVRFDPGFTPKDPAATTGYGFQFDVATFEGLSTTPGSTDKIDFMKGLGPAPSSGFSLGPMGLAFQYVGLLLSDSNNFNIGIGLTVSVGATLSVLVDNTTIGFNVNNELTVIGGGAQPYYQLTSPTASVGDYSPTGITISYTPNNYSRIQVFVNGQLQRLGDGTSSSVDCYFTPDGIIARTFSSIITGDELYWNGNSSGFDLSTRDKIDIVYEY